MERKRRRRLPTPSKGQRSPASSAPPAADQLLRQALHQHQAGQLQQAEGLYRQVLQRQADNADALHLLGLVHHQRSQHRQALEYIQRAIHADGDIAEFHASLAVVYLALGRTSEATDSVRRARQRGLSHAGALRNQGVCFLKQGRYDQAILCFQLELQIEPGRPETCHNLGFACHQLGQLDEAAAWFQKALQSKPGLLLAQLNLGLVRQSQGKLADAEQCYRHLLEVDPDHLTARFNLGSVLQQQEKLELAESCYQQVIAQQPQFAAAHYALGNIRKLQSRFDEAVRCYQQALHIKPDYAEAMNNLATVLQRQERFDKAAQYLVKAIACRPEYAEALNNLALVRQAQKQYADAIARFQQALRIKPDYAEAHFNLALVYQVQDYPDKAESHHRKAIIHRPDFAQAHHQLGNVLLQQKKLDEAEASFQQALQLKPDLAEAAHRLGDVRKKQGSADEAIACYRRAIEIDPQCQIAYVSLGLLQRTLGQTRAAISSFQRALDIRADDRVRYLQAITLPVVYESLTELKRYRRQLSGTLSQLVHNGLQLDPLKDSLHTTFLLAYQGLNDKHIQSQVARLWESSPIVPASCKRQPSVRQADCAKPISVGFLSAFLRRHTIGKLTRGLIANLSRSMFEVTVLTPEAHDCSGARWIERHADRYVVLPPDLRAAGQTVAQQNLDILIYPEIGMDRTTMCLARMRLAPIQCVTWGHPVTSGIPTMDYFISSRLLEAEHAQEHYTERLICLETLPAFYYWPKLPKRWKPRAHFGLPADAHIYLCPQSLFKFHPQFDGLLAEILKRDPQGLFVFLEGAFADWNQQLLNRFRRTLGGHFQRVIMSARQQRADFLNLLKVSDVMLDPLHFGGGNTNYEALAVGIPVVTLPSQLLRGRVAYALYRKMGLLDYVAQSPRQYVQRAVQLATDPDFRRRACHQIQQRRAVLFEDMQAVRQLEQFLQQAQQAAQASCHREHPAMTKDHAPGPAPLLRHGDLTATETIQEA